MDANITWGMLIQAGVFLLSFFGAAWKVNSVLGEIKTEIKLLNQKLDDSKTTLNDHEFRLRRAEERLAKLENGDS